MLIPGFGDETRDGRPRPEGLVRGAPLARILGRLEAIFNGAESIA
jgi:hypothetical protein